MCVSPIRAPKFQDFMHHQNSVSTESLVGGSQHIESAIWASVPGDWVLSWFQGQISAHSDQGNPCFKACSSVRLTEDIALVSALFPQLFHWIWSLPQLYSLAFGPLSSCLAPWLLAALEQSPDSGSSRLTASSPIHLVHGAWQPAAKPIQWSVT